MPVQAAARSGAEGGLQQRMTSEAANADFQTEASPKKSCSNALSQPKGASLATRVCCLAALDSLPAVQKV